MSCPPLHDLSAPHINPNRLIDIDTETTQGQKKTKGFDLWPFFPDVCFIATEINLSSFQYNEYVEMGNHWKLSGEEWICLS